MKTLSPSDDHAFVVAHGEAQPAREHVCGLLVGVLVAGNARSSREADPRDGHRLRVDDLAPYRGRQLLDGTLVPALHVHAASLQRP